MCGFNRGLSLSLQGAFAQLNCIRFFSKKTMTKLVEEAMNDSNERLKAFGRIKYCDDFMEGYNDAADIFNLP